MEKSKTKPEKKKYKILGITFGRKNKKKQEEKEIKSEDICESSERNPMQVDHKRAAYRLNICNSLLP